MTQRFRIERVQPHAGPRTAPLTVPQIRVLLERIRTDIRHEEALASVAPHLDRAIDELTWIAELAREVLDEAEAEHECRARPLARPMRKLC